MGIAPVTYGSPIPIHPPSPSSGIYIVILVELGVVWAWACQFSSLEHTPQVVRSRTHPYWKRKTEKRWFDVCKWSVVQTPKRQIPSFLPKPRFSDQRRRIDYPDFPGGCWFLFPSVIFSLHHVSSHDNDDEFQEKERKDESGRGSDRSERLIKMIVFNIVLGLWLNYAWFIYHPECGRWVVAERR